MSETQVLDAGQTARGDRPRTRRATRAGTVQRLAAALPFLLPKFLLFGFFILAPAVYTVILTFQQGSLLSGMTWNGLENFQTVFQDPLFRASLKTTLFFTLLTVPTTLVVTMFVGLLLASRVRGMSVYRSLIYLPSLLSAVGTALVWKTMIDTQSGPLNAATKDLLDTNVPWLTGETFTICFLTFITVWGSVGFYSIIFMAGFNNMPSELIDAARIDGANDRQVFFHIKLPLIRPIARIVLILTTVNAIQVFDLVYVLTDGGPGTATYTAMWYIYQTAFNGGSIAYGATMSVILLVITAIIAAVFMAGSRSEGSIYD